MCPLLARNYGLKVRTSTGRRKSFGPLLRDLLAGHLTAAAFVSTSRSVHHQLTYSGRVLRVLVTQCSLEYNPERHGKC